MKESAEKYGTHINDTMQPLAAMIARQSMGRVIEETIKSLEKEHQSAFLSTQKRPMNEHEKTYLRKLVLKKCREYLSEAIETLEYYQKT